MISSSSRLLEFVSKNDTYLYPAYTYIRSNVVHRKCPVMWDSPLPFPSDKTCMTSSILLQATSVKLVTATEPCYDYN